MAKKQLPTTATAKMAGAMKNALNESCYVWNVLKNGGQCVT